MYYVKQVGMWHYLGQFNFHRGEIDSLLLRRICDILNGTNSRAAHSTDEILK